MNRRQFLELTLGVAAAPSLMFADTKVSEENFLKDQLLKAGAQKPVNVPVYLASEEYIVGKRLHGRLKRIQSTVGYGNYNIIDFDTAVRIANRYSSVGAFEHKELELFEKLFTTNAAQYGFYGEKVVTSMTQRFPEKDMVKVPYTGHYLYKGQPLAHYERIRRSIGKSIVLTSGVRGVVKQMYLFLNKTYRVHGNLSMASNSLAPAGYSFHGVGDFDVGKVGYGHKNFTASFEETDEFKRLMELGFVDIRYTHKNPFGVRYEPWHVKVV